LSTAAAAATHATHDNDPNGYDNSETYYPKQQGLSEFVDRFVLNGDTTLITKRSISSMAFSLGGM
jgi:hypothetical protein